MSASAPAAGRRVAQREPSRLAVVRRGLGPYARPHRRALASALVASVLVTGVQLAFPWPLTLLVQRVTDPGSAPAWATPLVLTAGLMVLGVLFGLAELWQRVSLARFVVGTVNDARLGLFASLLARARDGRRIRKPGDVVTRMVSDTGKLRTGMKGLTVHVLQHGLFVSGVCTVLLVVDLRLGLLYLLGLALALGVAVYGAGLAGRAADSRRHRESKRVGRLLGAARAGTEVAVKDPGRDRSDARITHIKGLTAWAVQGVLGLTAGAILVLAVRATGSRLSEGDLALICSYLLMLHYPMMRLGRQTTRLGPQLSSAERLARMADPDDARTGGPR